MWKIHLRHTRSKPTSQILYYTGDFTANGGKYGIGMIFLQSGVGIFHTLKKTVIPEAKSRIQTDDEGAGVMPDSDSVIFLPDKVSMSRTVYDLKVPKLDYEQKRFDWAEKDT